MHQILQEDAPKLNVCSPSTHWINLFSQDITPTDVMNHVIKINIYSWNQYQPGAWLKDKELNPWFQITLDGRVTNLSADLHMNLYLGVSLTERHYISITAFSAQSTQIFLSALHQDSRLTSINQCTPHTWHMHRNFFTIVTYPSMSRSLTNPKLSLARMHSYHWCWITTSTQYILQIIELSNCVNKTHTNSQIHAFLPSHMLDTNTSPFVFSKPFTLDQVVEISL